MRCSPAAALFLLGSTLLAPPSAAGAEAPPWCASTTILAQVQELVGQVKRAPDALVELDPWDGCETVDVSKLGTGEPATCSMQAAVDYLAQPNVPEPPGGTHLLGVTAGGGLGTGPLVATNASPFPLVLAFCDVELTASDAHPAVISVVGGESPVTLIGVRLRGGAGAAGTGLLLDATSDVSLRDLRVEDFTDFAISGRDVTHLAISRATVTGENGDSTATDEGSIAFDNLQGYATITDSTIEGGHEDDLRIASHDGWLELEIRGTTFGPNGTESGNAGILVETAGHNRAIIKIAGNRFTASRGDHLRLSALGQADVQWVVQNNSFTNRHPRVLSGGGGATLSATGRDVRVRYDISENTFEGSLGSALTLYSGTGQARVSGRIVGNRIGRAKARLSGSAQANGIQITTTGAGSHVATIRDNEIRQYNETGIALLANNGTAEVDLTVTGNTLAEPGEFAYAGFGLEAGGGAGDRIGICLDFGDSGDSGDSGGSGPLANTLAGSGREPGGDFLLTVNAGGTLSLPGFDPQATTAAAYIRSRNAGAPEGRVDAEPGSLEGLPADRATCRTPRPLAEP